jgi:hypothetical protein
LFWLRRTIPPFFEIVADGSEGAPQLDHFSGRRIPKPVALSAEVRGDRLIVSLTVFGFAIYWASELVEAQSRRSPPALRCTTAPSSGLD